MTARLTVKTGNGRATRVASLAAASAACRAYIEAADLGASSWRGGDVYRGGTKIARISYNGRAWTLDGLPVSL